ncbi:MAG: helix-turn-helix domain-containing protein [Nitrospirota bacterium]
MKKEILIELGERIRSLRKHQGLSQETLAEKADMNPKYIGQIERGEVNSSVNTLQKVAIGLGATLSDLFSFLDTRIPATNKELLVAKFIGFIKDAKEERIEVIEEIIENIFNWMKKIED